MVAPPLRVAFFGTPAFALPTLEAIRASRHALVAVVTQPDRPRGRGQKLSPSPVKVFAETNGVAILQPERIKDETFRAAIDAARLDVAVVAAYGKILPRDLIDVPRLGMINVHASLLPRWRGAAPVHRAVMAGDRETGVTIMRIVPALDAGPMLAHAAVPIGPNETSADLEARLAALGAPLLVETLDRLAAGPVAETPQPEAGVTYAHRLERRESIVDWARPADAVHDQIRGLQPWPAAAVSFRGRRLLLLGSAVEHDRLLDAAPASVVAVSADALTVAARPGAVRLTRVQPEGRSAMAARDFLAGHRVAIGERFEPVAAG